MSKKTENKSKSEKYLKILLTPYKEYILRRTYRIKKIIILQIISITFLLYGAINIFEGFKQYITENLSYNSSTITLIYGIFFFILGYIIIKLK